MSKIFAIALRHWQPLTFWNVLVLGTATATTVISPRVWTATTQLTMPGTNGNLDANLGILGSLRNNSSEISSTQDNQLKMQESILSSDALQEKVLGIDPEKAKFTRLADYKKLFKVSIEEPSRIISVNVSSSSPELAKQRAMNLTNMYQKRLNELRLSNGASRRQFSEKELDITKRKLIGAQLLLARFKESSGLVDAEAQTKAVVSTIDTLTKAQGEALAQAEYSKNRVATLSSRLRMIPDSAVRSLSLSENQDYQFLRGKLAELDAQITQKRASFTEEHPSIQKLLQERQALRTQMQSHISQAAGSTQIDKTVNTQGEGRARLIEQLVLAETEASGQQRRAQEIQSQLEQLKNTLKSIPARQAQLVELQRQLDVTEGVYKGLVAQVQQTNIAVFDAYPNVEVLDPPRVDSKPVAPRLSLIVLNAILGAIVGSIALLLMLERRNPLLSPKDLQDMKFPIVVSVPRLKMLNNKWEQREETEVKFQRLASALSLQQLDNRRLLITSAIEGEGKTTVVLGLARALVDLGFRVLMVDADFRQGELSQRLSKGKKLNMIESSISIEENLHLLPTTPQRGKLLESVSRGRFERVLAVAESYARYDYVLVDTPPVSFTTATALMAAHIPNVLFVVRPSCSYSNSVRDSIEQLIQHRAQILGLVVNGVEGVTKPYKYRSHDALVE